MIFCLIRHFTIFQVNFNFKEFKEGMHTILSEEGGLAYNVKFVYHLVLNLFPYNTATATTRTNLNGFLNAVHSHQHIFDQPTNFFRDVTFTTSNRFHIKPLRQTIGDVKDNFTILRRDWLSLEEVQRELRGQEDYWLLTGLEPTFNSSWHVRRFGLSGMVNKIEIGNMKIRIFPHP